MVLEIVVKILPGIALGLFVQEVQLFVGRDTKIIVLTVKQVLAVRLFPHHLIFRLLLNKCHLHYFVEHD